MVESPFQVLGIPDTSTEIEVRERWRELLFTAHPDVGGDNATFINLRNAFNEALDLAHDRKCPRCGGSGFEEALAAGIRVKIRCGAC